jgi:hypothetical protein
MVSEGQRSLAKPLGKVMAIVWFGHDMTSWNLAIAGNATDNGALFGEQIYDGSVSR